MAVGVGADVVALLPANVTEDEAGRAPDADDVPVTGETTEEPAPPGDSNDAFQLARCAFCRAAAASP